MESVNVSVLLYVPVRSAIAGLDRLLEADVTTSLEPGRCSVISVVGLAEPPTGA